MVTPVMVATRRFVSAAIVAPTPRAAERPGELDRPRSRLHTHRHVRLRAVSARRRIARECDCWLCANRQTGDAHAIARRRQDASCTVRRTKHAAAAVSWLDQGLRCV